MFNMLQEEMRGDITWDRVEAILWIIAAIAPNVGNECVGLPEMLDGILRQDAASTHPCMRITSLKLIGDLYMWISHHRDNWLENCFQFLLAGLAETGPCQKEFQLVAAESLKSICTSCRQELAKHYESLIHATDEILDELVWKAAHNLLTGISYVVSECKYTGVYKLYENF